MKKTKARQKIQYTHKLGPAERQHIYDKLRCYEIYITFSSIACCILQYLSLYKSKDVWSVWDGWLRTIRPQMIPSIEVSSKAMKQKVLEY